MLCGILESQSPGRFDCDIPNIHGVERSSAVSRNLHKVEDFVSRLEVLSYDENAAAHYGNIRADLEKKGTPIVGNGLHAAGHARSKSLILVTNSIREFERVEGLRLENWID